MTTAVALARPAVLDHALSVLLSRTEYERFHATLVGLTPQDWAKPTDCSDWNVRAMAAHVLGMAEMAASMREQVRQVRRALRADGSFIDGLTALQVARHEKDTPADISAAFARVMSKAVAGRRRTPGFVRSRRLPIAQEVDGVSEHWTIGFLVDVILTRDTWMHRLDLAVATGRRPELTADHDGVIVADVVAEWASRHGQPCRLTLTGPAGGSWSWGTDGEVLELPATEFCRMLSGRGRGVGLLAVQVPF